MSEKKAVTLKELFEELCGQGKKGREIARALLNKDFSIKEVRVLFFDHSYAVYVSESKIGSSRLYVSDYPARSSKEGFGMKLEPELLPYVVWEKDSDSTTAVL